MTLHRRELLDELGDGVATELRALADYQPIDEIVRDLMERHSEAATPAQTDLLHIQFMVLLRLPVSSSRKTAWKYLVEAALKLPHSTNGKAMLLELVAGDLCKTVAGEEFQ